MAELTDLLDKLKRYFKFTPLEIRSLIISVLVVAFIISFRDWGIAGFSFRSGLFNYFNFILITSNFYNLDWLLTIYILGHK